MIDKLKKEKKEQLSEEEKKAKEDAKQADDYKKERKRAEAIELIGICLESFAYYYYVQRRALVGQEIDMFETKLCQSFNNQQVS